MEKDKLRKADLFSGGIIVLTGLFIVIHALGMPMKDSWGGVQNVWYVSPAIFPLFVGCVIMVLGALLVRTAVKAVGIGAVSERLAFLRSPELAAYLKQPANVRFFAIVILFVSFVFLLLPRVDFFLAAILFLMAFISMFYFDDHVLLVKLLGVFCLEMAVVLLFFLIGAKALAVIPYPGDWLVLFCIFGFGVTTYRLSRPDPVTARRFRLVLILSLAAPVIIGGVFKYLLMVPMPFEGMVVAVMDTVWYWEF